MKWAEISIQTSHEATEAVAEIFHELGASGVLIEDPELVNDYIHSGAWDYTDIPLAEETDTVTVKAWLPTDEDLPNKLSSSVCIWTNSVSFWIKVRARLTAAKFRMKIGLITGNSIFIRKK